MNDPIVDEVRRVRDEHAARFNYDLHAIFLDIKKREKERGLHFVDGVVCQPLPNKRCSRPGPPFRFLLIHKSPKRPRRLSL